MMTPAHDIGPAADWRGALRDAGARCPGCGYDLSGGIGERCPECNRALRPALALPDPWRRLRRPLLAAAAGQAVFASWCVFSAARLLLDADIRTQLPFPAQAWTMFGYLLASALASVAALVWFSLVGWRHPRSASRLLTLLVTLFLLHHGAAAIHTLAGVLWWG